MKEFAGKVAVVTGAGQGIGRALVERFTDEGMKVVLADVVPALVEQTTGELRDEGRDVVGVVTDVTSLESVETLRDASSRRCANTSCSGRPGGRSSARSSRTPSGIASKSSSIVLTPMRSSIAARSASVAEV